MAGLVENIFNGVGRFTNYQQLVNDSKIVKAEAQSGWQSFFYDARADAVSEVQRLLPLAILEAAYELQGDFPDDTQEGGFRFKIFNSQERELIANIKTNHATFMRLLHSPLDENNPQGPTLLESMYALVDKLTLPLEEGLEIELKGNPGEAITNMLKIADANKIQLLPEDVRDLYRQVHKDREAFNKLLSADLGDGRTRKDEIIHAFEEAVKELSIPKKDPNNPSAKPKPEGLFDETNRIKTQMLHYMDEYDMNNDARADANGDEVKGAAVEMALATTGGILRMLGFGYITDLLYGAVANFNISVDISHLPDAVELFANNILNLAIDNPVKALALVWGTTLLSVGLSKIGVKGTTDTIQMIQQRFKLGHTRREGMKALRALRQDYINRGIIPGRKSRRPATFSYTIAA